MPVSKDSQVIGVLDLDSPQFGRFDDDDRAGLELLMRSFVELTEIVVP